MFFRFLRRILRKLSNNISIWFWGLMFYYPDELIEEIRLNSDLVEIVSEYLRLEKEAPDISDYAPFTGKKLHHFTWNR